MSEVNQNNKRKILGPATAYAIAVENGYVGTEEQFGQYLANAVIKAQETSQSASAAATSATNADNSAKTAEGYASGTMNGVPISDTQSIFFENNAKYHADRAENAKDAVEDMTAVAVTLPAGSAATVTKTVDPQTGAVTLTFGVPRGADGSGGGAVSDVQIDGTSILDAQGAANIPIAGGNTLGVVKCNSNSNSGVSINANGQLGTIPATSAEIKGGSLAYKPIGPYRQHEASFYGLAKAAGSDEKNSTLPVGQYTDSAKAAIKKMLGFGYYNYEFIKMVTVTEDTQQIIIDTDEASNSFSLKGFLLLIQSVGASSSTAESYLKVGLNTNNHDGNRIMDSTSGIRRAGSTRSYALFGACIDGIGHFIAGVYMDSAIFDSSDNISTIHIQTSLPAAFSNQAVINSVFVGTDMSTRLLGVGSKVALYGMKV